MIKMNWTWTLLLVGSSALALLSCHRIEYPSELFFNFITQVFVYGFCCWVLCGILGRIYSAFRLHSEQLPPEHEIEEEWHERMRLQQQKIRQSMQAKFDKQTQRYRKRIIEPREEKRKKKQDKQINLIRDQFFPGQGQESGYNANRPTPPGSSNNGNANDDAREKRHLPDHIRLHRPRHDSPKPVVKEQKKRLIKLPDEPDEADDNGVIIVLHTPIDQKYSRRFLNSCKLQVLFDYMTTLGFSQSHYTLVQFPRIQLADLVDKSLLDLKFGKRTVLHIAERD